MKGEEEETYPRAADEAAPCARARTQPRAAIEVALPPVPRFDTSYVCFIITRRISMPRTSAASGLRHFNRHGGMLWQAV